MALIECPECSGKVSDLALSCPHCGFPVAGERSGPEQELLAVSPRLFGGNPFTHLVVIILCIALVGFAIYFVEWLRVRATRLIITTRRTTLKKGILEKATNEVLHADIRNVRVTQGFVDRLLGIGTIELSSAGQSDVEIAVKGLPDPQQIADLIREHR